MSMIKLKIPIVVEGKYDKAKLSQVVDGTIITTEGFGVFNNREKAALLRRLGENGIIVLCDSDGGGTVIRGHLKSILGERAVYDLYIPQIPGKERRKKQGGKAGLLGVEGMDNGLLHSLFAKMAEKHPEILAEPATDGTNTAAEPTKPLNKTDLYCLGLTGVESSAQRRNTLCRHIGFPVDMTPNALLSALQMLYTLPQLTEICAELFGE